MSATRYKRLTDIDLDADINTIPESRSIQSTLIGFILLFGFVACMIFLTSVQAHPARVSLQDNGKNSPILRTRSQEKPRKRNITKWMDNYFTADESQFLNCSEMIKNNKDVIELYVNNGRMKLDNERLFELPMDCPSIKNRIYGDMPSFRPLKRPIAFVRTIYKIYELQEALLSISYHPDNVFCFVMDSKSTDRLKESVRIMSSCFTNVVVLGKEYSLNSGGHGQDPAHFDCLKTILDRKWDHAIILQNFDLIIKTPYQLSDISESLNYTSIMGFDHGFSYRYNTKAKWTPAGMKLFKIETGVPNEILNRNLIVRKSLNEVIVSKVFVKSMFEKLNMDIIIKLFDDNDYYGVDEMLVQTLYENYLGLEGQMESNCTRNHNDILTRMTHWDFSGPNGFDKECHSKWKRHGICIMGVEYMNELIKSQQVIANKVMATFDFGTIACMREMIKRNTAGETPNTQWLTSFPQFREMQQKANGTYDRNKFDC
ncbi:Nucleotid_trans domain-containing protein [Caenorhabditis elegans]|uniref:Nucleotid_trans domain-containing protein n=2 Tax=Caenorhabditis elegans TaxID=6239 RepID=Q21796_CAEEL|nr:Nucleotid_trans domain-containing protein [Caenorhabditis elegans]CAB00115.2 Nucleotid_trans domain-containing protein [Caenorhabditis elegans]|eukprot:NP_001256399.1 Uncharacterized protein CELE_R07B7.6 [Caenorhabditis elegans]